MCTNDIQLKTLVEKKFIDENLEYEKIDIEVDFVVEDFRRDTVFRKDRVYDIDNSITASQNTLEYNDDVREIV